MKIPFLSNKYSLTNILAVLIEVNYLALIFLVPLWFAYFFPTFHMFEFNKLIIFRLLLWIFVFLTFSRLLLSPADIWQKFYYACKSKKFYNFLFPLILVFGLLLLLPFSDNTALSFFGSMERQQGLLSYLHYFLWSLILFFNLYIFNRGNEWRKKVLRIVLVITTASTLVAIYGILQILNIDFITWPEPPFLTGRALSTFGQPNFLASYLLLTIPLAAYLVHFYKRFLHNFLYLLALILQIFCLFFTSSRGGLLAFFALLLIFVAYLFFRSKLSKKVKIFLVLGTVCSFIISVAAMEYTIPGRIESLLDFKRGSLAARVYFFQAAANAILQKPVVGYGLETGLDVFITYYERDWALFGDVNANTDRAHNIILDILISGGFISLMMYALWYYYFFRLASKQSFQLEKNYLSLALLLGSLAYFISLFFSFIIVGGEIYFWLYFSLLTIISVMDNKSGLDEADSQITKKAELSVKFKWFIFIIVSVVSGWQFIFSLQALKADYYLNEMQKSVNELDFITAAVLKEEAMTLNINPIQRENIQYFLYNNLSNLCLYGGNRDLAEETIIMRKINQAVLEVTDSGYKNIFLKARLFACLKNEEKANEYFDRLHEISPAWPLAYLERGNYLLKIGNLAEAEKYYQLADINLPEVTNPAMNSQHKKIITNFKHLMYSSLGDSYLQQGNYERAELFLQAAYKYKIEDYSILKKIADTYYLRGDIGIALKYINRGATLNPLDYNWWLAMAVLYLEQEDKDNGLKYLSKALLMAPNEEQDKIKNLILQHSDKE